MVDDEEAVGEMLSCYPARDVDGPATKADIAALRADVQTDVQSLRGEVMAQGHTLRGEMADMEIRLMKHSHAEIRASLQWTVGIMISLFGMLIAAIALFT